MPSRAPFFGRRIALALLTLVVAGAAPAAAAPDGAALYAKYCALCRSDYGPRLTEDGQFYCIDCREACDYKTQDQVRSR